MKQQSIRLKTAALACGMSSLALAGDPVVTPEAAPAESGSMFNDFNLFGA